MNPGEAADGEHFPLTAEHRMLLRIRDTLYEGSWEDFVHDLKARAADKPHVFDVIPPSATMKSTIKNHLAMIAAMAEWEEQYGRPLRPDEDAAAHR